MRRTSRRMLARVTDEFENKCGYVPGNLQALRSHIRLGGDQMLRLAMTILKGYFVWQSHVVQPTPREARALEGLPILRSETYGESWRPTRRLDGHRGWSEPVHVVRIGREVFRVTRLSHYHKPRRGRAASTV